MKIDRINGKFLAIIKIIKQENLTDRIKEKQKC